MRRVHGKVRSGWIRIVTAGATLGLAVALAPAALAQTPDGTTPAEEEACDKYVGEGARHGLCIAFTPRQVAWCYS